MTSWIEQTVPREAMPLPSPYLAFQVDRTPFGPQLKVASELVKISQNLIDNSPYMSVVDDQQLTITCTNAVAVYKLGDVVETVKNEKNEVVDTFREARRISLEPPPRFFTYASGGNT